MKDNFLNEQANEPSKQKRMRVLNSSKYLSAYLSEGERFHVGLLYDDYVNSLALEQYNLPEKFEEGKSFIPKGKKSVSRANIKGKFVRKQPEEKKTKTVHIQYTKKDGTRMNFYRDYYAYVKQLLHQYNMPFTFKTNEHGQKIVVSPSLIYDDREGGNIKNTHSINLFCEIFNDFEIFNANLEPAIHFNKRFEMELLPKGALTESDNFEEVIRISNHYVKSDQDQRAFQKRLHILQEYDPDIRGKGPNNFFGYIVFGFSDLDIVLLETMYSDNATYVFRLSEYEDNIIKDKQSVLKNKLMLGRFYHDANWEFRIRNFLNQQIKKRA